MRLWMRLVSVSCYSAKADLSWYEVGHTLTLMRHLETILHFGKNKGNSQVQKVCRGYILQYVILIEQWKNGNSGDDLLQIGQCREKVILEILMSDCSAVWIWESTCPSSSDVGRSHASEMLESALEYKARRDRDSMLVMTWDHSEDW